MKKEIQRAIICFLILSIIGMGLQANVTQSWYLDEVRLLVNGQSFSNGDSKMFLLIDVPSTGGKAVEYLLYEVENNGLSDDWWFYEYSPLNWYPIGLELNFYDYIIVVNTNSDGSGGYDEFTVSLTVYDSGQSYSSCTYQFGDKYSNYIQIAIWQFQDFGQLKFANSGDAVAKWTINGEYSYWSGGFDYYDWYSIESYLDDYFGGNEQKIETLIYNYNFPDPYPN
ncbi:MAG: hypothetical protein FK730_12770 [Asgard group archaeon]|nr:hypothetical protein [Asgard group archaeon]